MIRGLEYKLVPDIQIWIVSRELKRFLRVTPFGVPDYGCHMCLYGACPSWYMEVYK